MKLIINETTPKYALNLHKDYFNFIKANKAFMIFAFLLFGIANFSEFLIFNNSEFLNLHQSVGTAANASSAVLPSFSFITWLFFIVYMVSYFFGPALIIWFNQNNNITKDKKTRKAAKINAGFLKILGKTFFNLRLYLVILLASFMMLFGLVLILRTIPEIANGLDGVIKEVLVASQKGIAFDSSKSSIYQNYISGINSISYVQWTLAAIEAVLTIVIVHAIYFVSLPLVLLNKEVGAFKSIYLALKAVVINWATYASFLLASILILFLTKSFEGFLIFSRILSILFPTLILPYLIILNKAFFKKI